MIVIYFIIIISSSSMIGQVIATRFDLEAAVTGAAKKADGGDLAGAII